MRSLVLKKTSCQMSFFIGWVSDPIIPFMPAKINDKPCFLFVIGPIGYLDTLKISIMFGILKYRKEGILMPLRPYEFHSQASQHLEMIVDQMQRFDINQTVVAQRTHFSEGTISGVLHRGVLPSPVLLLAMAYVVGIRWTIDDLPPALGNWKRPETFLEK
jgi:hypothetical protein